MHAGHPAFHAACVADSRARDWTRTQARKRSFMPLSVVRCPGAFREKRPLQVTMRLSSLPSSSSVLLVVVTLLSCLVAAREVPMKKAIPPKMDPIPTLPEITHRVYFNIEIDGESAGKIVFGLFGNNSPEAVENFLALAKCNKGNGAVTGKSLCYKGSSFHRIIPNFGMQGGDFTHGDGTGGETIYGARFEADMKELVKFNRPYMLAVSAAKRQASSQFFITTVKAQWLTGKHTIFGTVLEDRSNVVDEIEKYGTYGGKPKAKVTIVSCGEEPLRPEDKEPHY